MVSTRRSASAAASSIPAARALRRERRSRTIEAEILHPAPAQTRTKGRQRRSPSSKAGEAVVLIPPFEDEKPSKMDERKPQTGGKTQLESIREQEAINSSSPSGSTSINPPQTDQPKGPGGNLSPHPTRKRWFGTFNDIPTPNPAAPIFKPAESLFDFATGATSSRVETKPFEQSCSVSNPAPASYPNTDHSPEAISAQAARRNEAIGKAAIAVMAHMNGYGVAEAEYASILNGMLQDPDMRLKLPPALIEQYDAAVKGNPTRLYNGGLIDKFIHATKRATDVTATILMRSKNAKRERKARGARNRALQTYCSAGSAQHPQVMHHDSLQPESKPFGNWTFRQPNNGCEDGDPLTPSLSQQLGEVPLPGTFAQPLTEANLNECVAKNSAKGKSRENLGPWDEERPGVMRTARGSFRAGPYPRRPSGETRVSLGQESGYSVYSASSVHRQAEAHRLASSMMSGVKDMLRPGSSQAEDVRKAEALIEETRRTKGQKEADSIRRGFDLLHCYDIVKQVNVDLLADALLEHMSEASRPQPEFQGSSLQALAKPFNEVVLPTRQLCEHPRLGRGVMSFVRVFEPVDANNQQLLHPKIMLDPPIRDDFAP